MWTPLTLTLSPEGRGDRPSLCDCCRVTLLKAPKEAQVMAEIRVPTLGESVTEATIGKWFKKPGEAVAVDEPLVELETDKVTIEVPAPAAGVLADIAAKDGQTVAVGALLGQIKEGAKEGTSAPAAKPAAAPTGRPDQKTATTTPINAAEEEPKPRVPPKA